MKFRLRERIKSKSVTLGTWITIGSPDIPDILSRLGFDWFVFDLEHSPLTLDTVGNMIRATREGISPIVRVGEVDQYMIKAVLDIGSEGIVVPLVNSKSDAENAVKFAKYPPVGVRGAAPTRASGYGFELSKYIREANENVIIIAQIETAESIRNLDEILAVEGVDVAFVGPTDLSVSLGLIDDRGNPALIEKMRFVVDRCKKYGKVAGTLVSSIDEAERAMGMGFSFISLASDSRFLIKGASMFLEGLLDKNKQK